MIISERMRAIRDAANERIYGLRNTGGRIVKRFNVSPSINIARNLGPIVRDCRQTRRGEVCEFGT